MIKINEDEITVISMNTLVDEDEDDYLTFKVQTLCGLTILYDDEILLEDLPDYVAIRIRDFLNYAYPVKDKIT